MKYVPQKYIKKQKGQFILWHDVKETSKDVQKICDVIKEAIEEPSHLLGFIHRRVLHFCMYRTNSMAKKQLNRAVNGTILMAPLSTLENSLIIFHSPSVNPINGDKKRMKRHLIHEVCHQFINEKSDSTKELGDNNKNLYTPPWFNEGLSELIAHTIMQQPIVKKCIQRDLDLNELNKDLESLFSEKRNNAFEQAITIVNHLAQSHGIKYIFNNCLKINNICK
jgi:hypothetical protein